MGCCCITFKLIGPPPTIPPPLETFKLVPVEIPAWFAWFTREEPARSRFSGRWTIMWTSRLDLVPNDSLHTSHLYGLAWRWMSW
jgi:hypothetical protein